MEKKENILNIMKDFSAENEVLPTRNTKIKDRFLYKAKSIRTNKLVIGHLLSNKLGNYIIVEENPHECDDYSYIVIEKYEMINESTLSQCTGLKDSDGKLIFENDTLKFRQTDLHNENKWSEAKVKWYGDEGYPAFDLDTKDFDNSSNILSYITQSGEFEYYNKN